MFENIVPGLVGEAELVVGPENTARHLGSGNVAVLATPEMVRLMERASVAAVDPLLPEGYRSVGVALEVKHIAPTPVGMAVRAQAELLAVDGRKLTFRVEAWDAVEKIGEGTHQRAIVELARFGAKAAQKASSLLSNT